jgi:hypothetical protein
MKLEFEITYEDGQTQHVKVRPKHLVAMEDAGVKVGDSAKSSFQIAHAAAATGETFESWLDRVEDIETITDEQVNGSGPRPTQEESPTSPS